jgi:anti-sigma factor RsiW
MNCRRTRESLPLYLAEELSPQAREAIRRHLSACSACRDEAEQFAAAEELARAAFREEVAVPEDLDDRVMRAVRALPPSRQSWLARWFGPGASLAPIAAAGLALLLMAIGWQLGSRLGKAAAGSPVLELTALGTEHERLATSAGDEIPGASRERVAAELSARVRFPVSAIDLSPEATQLVGGAATRLRGTAIACLHYQWNGARVTLFQMETSRLTPPGLREFPHQVESYSAERHNGISYVAWRSGPIGCVLVSREMPMHRLFQLACHACERQSQHSESETNTRLRPIPNEG